MAQETITIKVVKHAGVWKAVVDTGPMGFADPKVDPEDIVQWDPIGTDITINFPEPKVFYESELIVHNSEKKSLIVMSQPEVGTHPYSVFCHEERKYAQGAIGPPPVIIVPSTTTQTITVPKAFERLIVTRKPAATTHTKAAGKP